ncbi:CFAP43 [Symbiodinium sp. CCMP2592]|nr:CFAP43 [Symbiodinium sp. CCMP2592]
MRRSADGSVPEEICKQQGCSVPLPSTTCLSLSRASLPLPPEASTVGIPNKGVPGFSLLEARCLSGVLNSFQRKKARKWPPIPTRIWESSPRPERKAPVLHEQTTALLSSPRPKEKQLQVEDDIKFEDCPEGVDEDSFNRMLELRAEKLRAEAEVARGVGAAAAVLSEMGGFLGHLEREPSAQSFRACGCMEAKAENDRLERELREHKALMGRELYDIEILFKLKQGQVEVPQAAVVTDYSDAIVIDQEVVESRNRRITELGKDKVHILTKIKEFRKSLSTLDWEHEMLALQTTDLEERTKDVHMLRVTKDLQSLLKGGEEGRNKAESDLLERKIEHLSEATEKKEQALKKQYSMLAHAAKLSGLTQGRVWDMKLRELQQNVIQREHIRRLRAPSGQPQKTGGGGRVEDRLFSPIVAHVALHSYCQARRDLIRKLDGQLLSTASPLHLPPSPPLLAVPGLVIVLSLDGCWTSQSRFAFIESEDNG